MKKVELDQLTKEDAENLFNNSNVWNKVTEFMLGAASDRVNDYISIIGGDVVEYSISDSSYPGNYLSVRDPYRFIASLKDLSNNFGLLDKPIVVKGEGLLKKYDDEVVNEDELQKFSDQAAKKLLKIFVGEYDCIYDEKFVEDNILDYCEDIYGEDAYYDRDTNKIFYISCDWLGV